MCGTTPFVKLCTISLPEHKSANFVEMAQALISSGWFSFELRVTVPVHELVSFTRMSLDAKKDGAQMCSV